LTTLWKPGYPLEKYRVWYRSETTSLKRNEMTGWRKRAVVGKTHTRAPCYFFRCGIYDGLGMSSLWIADLLKSPPPQ
jgi:hypothetical protein